jgi:hypothetical protein
MGSKVKHSGSPGSGDPVPKARMLLSRLAIVAHVIVNSAAFPFPLPIIIIYTLFCPFRIHYHHHQLYSPSPSSPISRQTH